LPSQKVLEEKKAVVASVADRLKNSVAGVVVSYEGINVEDDTQLRRELREAGVQYTVVKNTLLGRAAEEAGLDDLKAVLEGTTALATSAEDHTAAARILAKYAEKNEKFTIKSGYLDGKVVGVDTIDALAKLPSRDVLLATVCNALNATIAGFARAVQAIADNGGGEASIAKKEAEAAPAEA